MEAKTPLAKLRLARGCDQKQVADGAGIDRGQYSRMESGKDGISVRAAFKLARFFDVPPQSLLYPDEYPIACIDSPLAKASEVAA